MGHVAGMGEVKTSYQIFGILMQVRDLLGGPQDSWNDNIKMDIKDASFIFRQLFNTRLGKAGFFETLMRLLCIETINIFKILHLEFSEVEFKSMILLGYLVKIFLNF